MTGDYFVAVFTDRANHCRMNHTVNFDALYKMLKILIISYLKRMIGKCLELFQRNAFYCLLLFVLFHNVLLYLQKLAGWMCFKSFKWLLLK